MVLAPDQMRLIDAWQREFPLVPRPFAVVAEAQSVSEARVLEMVRELHATGVLSRIGVTVRPNTVGASLLAAMRVAPERLDEIAAIVSEDRCVNHNYEREHDFNLWFVATAPDSGGLSEALARLRAATGHDIMELPLERGYHIDLGFSLNLGRDARSNSVAMKPVPAGFAIDPVDRRLLAAIEDGIELQPRPYLALARRCGLSEEDVIAILARLIEAGIVTRFGLIVRHRTVGITANAMAVWDISDSDVDRIGQSFAAAPFVTLCYRRRRRAPDWPYNLFTMVHGRDRSLVESQIAALANEAAIGPERRAILFSRRCFVQRGARFKAA